MSNMVFTYIVIVFVFFLSDKDHEAENLPNKSVNYPRATRCGGDIVTLLWFRPCVRAWFRPSVRPCMDLVNTIETTPLLVFSSNLVDMSTMMRG